MAMGGRRPRRDRSASRTNGCRRTRPLPTVIPLTLPRRSRTTRITVPVEPSGGV